jgi:hypothetical protein
MSLHSVTVSILVVRPDLPPHTDADFSEWLDYVTGNSSSGIAEDNPLLDIDLRDASCPGTLRVST